MNQAENRDELIVLFLENRLSEKEVRDFFDWISASKENERYFFEIKAIHDSRNFYGVNIKDSWNRLELKLKRKEFERKKRNQWKRRWMASAAAVILLLLGWSGYLVTRTEDQGLISFTTGTTSGTVHLPDGTYIKLGANSTLSYTEYYGKKDRKVRLAGEGFFDVAKNAKLPFTVTSGEQCIYALGTKFNIRSYLSDSVFTTTLLEGSVRFTASNIKTTNILRPGEQLEFNRDKTEVEIKSVDTEEVVSWLNSYYTFHCEELKGILKRMSYIYNKEIVCEDSATLNTIYKGTFYEGQDLNDFLEVIQIATGLNYKKEEERIILYRGK